MDGANDGLAHVDFPASSPHALACGGTRLVTSGGTITSETVWNDGSSGGAGGGGVSDAFALPSWQDTAGVPASANAGASASAAGNKSAGDKSAADKSADHEGVIRKVEALIAEHRKKKPAPTTGSGGGSGTSSGRGVPDVAGNADPETGYQIMADGQMQVVGGTSAVAPLWAALIARLAQATGKPFGLIQPALYAGITPGVDVAGFHDIVSGNNGAYSAGPGWDACSGLGSPNAPALLKRLQA